VQAPGPAGGLASAGLSTSSSMAYRRSGSSVGKVTAPEPSHPVGSGLPSRSPSRAASAAGLIAGGYNPDALRHSLSLKSLPSGKDPPGSGNSNAVGVGGDSGVPPTKPAGPAPRLRQTVSFREPAAPERGREPPLRRSATASKAQGSQRAPAWGALTSGDSDSDA
jgi:hypothetical protein